MSDRDSGPSLVQNRRQFLGNAAAIGAAGVLPASIALSDAASAQGASDTLVIAAPATPQGLDIEFDVSLGSIDTLGAIYEYMLGYEKMADPNAPGVLREDTGVHPDKPNGLALKGKLAESWELAPDGCKATFKLREGVKSNWGNPFTAKDVKWTWDRKFNLRDRACSRQRCWACIRPIRSRSKATTPFRSTSTSRTRSCSSNSANLANPIYDGTKCAEVGGKDDPWAVEFLKNDSAGFGPYRLKQLVRGQQAVFEARDDYWGDKPVMKRVIMKEVPTSSSRLSLLQGGAVDIAQFLQPRELQALKGLNAVAVDAVNASYAIWLELNADMKPFDNVDVRRAFNYAIPQDEIIRTIYYGYADKQTAPMPYIYPMVDTSFFDYDLNLDKAKELLAKAGLASGFETTISYNAGDPTQEPIALLIQTSLRKVGINVTLEKLPAGVFYEAVTKRQKTVIFYLDSPWTPDPGYSMYQYFNQKSYVDYSNDKNDHVDQLITEGLETLDDKIRMEKYKEVQRILMGEAPWGFLAYPKYTLARKANLKGFTYYTSNNLRFQDFSRG